HGWEHIPWYTITDDFDKDFDVDQWHGTNAFLREDDRIFRTYFIPARGAGRRGGGGGRARGVPANPAVPVVELPRRLQPGQVITHLGNIGGGARLLKPCHVGQIGSDRWLGLKKGRAGAPHIHGCCRRPTCVAERRGESLTFPD